MTSLEGVRLTLSQPDTDSFLSQPGLANVPDLDTGELYYTEDRAADNKIIPRLFTKTSNNEVVCLTPHVFSGTNQPTQGYRDGDIWIKTAN